MTKKAPPGAAYGLRVACWALLEFQEWVSTWEENDDYVKGARSCAVAMARAFQEAADAIDNEYR